MCTMQICSPLPFRPILYGIPIDIVQLIMYISVHPPPMDVCTLYRHGRIKKGGAETDETPP